MKKFIQYSRRFAQRTLSILAYNLETVLAEKLETVLSRNVANTRPRDYYDIHILYTLRGAECKKDILRQALERTAYKRGSQMILIQYKEILEEIRKSPPTFKSVGKISTAIRICKRNFFWGYLRYFAKISDRYYVKTESFWHWCQKVH